MKKVDVDDRIIIPKISKKSFAKWIVAKDFIPEHSDKYLCIVEKEMILGPIKRNGKMYGSHYEVCYYNHLMEAWQDHTLEVAEVTHWLPIPKLPNSLKLKSTTK